MRFLCIIESLGSGGAERQLVGLASLLKKDGYEVAVMTYFPKDFYKDDLDKASVKFIYVAGAESKFWRIPRLSRAILSFKPDVVIVFTPSAAIITCLLKMMGWSYKLIVSERNTTQCNDSREKVKFFFYKWADWIVPNSHEQENFIGMHYVGLLPKVETITNFVDTDFFCPADNYVSHQTCRIICVGRDNPQKNQLGFIDAIKLLAEKGLLFKVDWYGSFESDYGQQCVRKIKDLHLEDRIELKGEIKNVRDEYRKHDVFCLPSIYEGFPNVLCEAMSCGLPIVCSNVCDNPLIVQEGVNGFLFDPTNTEEMARTIEKMVMLNEVDKKRMRVANREKSLEMFSKEFFLAKYKKLF